MKKNYKDMTRKLFYVFDMVLFGLLLFSIEHTMFRENMIIDTMLDVALILRIIIPFLLYRYEKMAVWPILLFVVLFGGVIYSDVFYNTILNMGEFPSIVLSSGPGPDYGMIYSRNTTGMALMRGVIYWIWLIPVAVYVIQFACKLTKNNDYPWYYFLGVIMFKDKAAKTFLRMAAMIGIAYLIGYEMQEHLSFVALVALPLVGYYYWNKHIEREPHWTEYVILFVGLYIFDKAQFEVNDERIMYLTASAMVIFGVCCWMAYKSRNFLISVLAFFMIAFLLPTLSLGYNVYQSIEGARSVNYGYVGLSNSKGYMYIKRSETINGKEIRLVGVRDRYRTTIPCEYCFVFPTKMFSPFAKCIKENRDSVIRSVEEGYILE